MGPVFCWPIPGSVLFDSAHIHPTTERELAATPSSVIHQDIYLHLLRDKRYMAREVPSLKSLVAL